jgi:hypothetical protein
VSERPAPLEVAGPRPGAARALRVLFIAKDPFYVRNFESLVRALDARGHAVHMSFETHEGPASARALVERLERELPHFTTDVAPKRASRRWRRTSDPLRRALDYIRQLDAHYDAAPGFRARARRQAPAPARRVADSPALGRPAVARALAGALRIAEEGVPVSRTLTRFVRAQRPDVLVASPLVQLGSRQADFLRAARRIGVPTCFCAYSWDSFVTKGLVRGDPDLVTVWNEPQRREAIELHGVEPERVVAVGASAYDHWFGWRPRTTRAEFCAEVGLPAERPYLLYVGSALITGQEGEFMAEWVRRLRGSGHPELRDAGLLVRPHPQRPPSGSELAALRAAGAAVWPRPEASVIGQEAREALFDSIFHARAVVGLNTTAFIDAAIIGRPCYALLPARFRDSQEETLHFRYLLDAGGGTLSVAESFEEHASQLAEALADGRPPFSSRRFVEAFVRPAGLERPATDVLVGVIERLAEAPARPAAARPVAHAAGWVLALGLSEAIRWGDPGERRRALRGLRRRRERALEALRARAS